jgi:hypothetical protein
MVNPMEKERIITIGKILVDFANAETTNSACNTYFNNIKNLFNFSSKFDEHIKAVFPSLDSCFEPLNKTEKSLAELIIRESTLKDYLNQQFIPIDYELETYDPFNNALNLVSLKWDRNLSEAASEKTALLDENRQSIGFLESLKGLGVSAVDGPISIKIDALMDEINDLMGSTAVSKIRELMDLGRKIDILTTDFTEQRLKELYELCEVIRNILKLHSKVEKLQADIKTILETVATDKSLTKSTIFLSFIDRYNSLPKGELLISENDVLVQMPPINENSYFQIDNIEMPSVPGIFCRFAP